MYIRMEYGQTLENVLRNVKKQHGVLSYETKAFGLATLHKKEFINWGCQEVNLEKLSR